MAAGWVKSWQCKSNAWDDVYHPNPKSLLPTSSSCRKSAQNLKDVIDNTTSKSKHGKPPLLSPKKSHSSEQHHQSPPSHRRKRHSQSQPQSPSNTTPHSQNGTSQSTHHRKSKSQSHSHTKTTTPLDRSSRQSVSGRLNVKSPTTPIVVPEPFFPSLSELPDGHPSRNVVEIIFHTRWGPKGFSGRVEMVFKIQSVAKAVSRFEEYRESVKSRAGSDDDLVVDCTNSKYEDRARCVADGNEMMRFHCLGPTSGVTNDAVVGGFCAINDGGGGPGGGNKKGGAMTTSICTYSGSGAAHDSVGGGKGRRAMVVCRVVAGRVYKRFGIESVLDRRVGFDSVSGEKGELLVFDPRAVLPCFLVIYNKL